MIEWKKFDSDNPPEINKEYLIFNKYSSLCIAELQRYSYDDKLYWIETGELHKISGVTHYAEINYPNP